MDWNTLASVATVAMGVIAVGGAIFAAFRWLHGVRTKRSVSPPPPEPQPEPEPEYTVVGAAWVLARGWSYEKLVKRLIQLDELVLPHLTPEIEGTVEQWAPVFGRHPETWALIVNRHNMIAGYWSFSSLSAELLARLKAGMLNDCDVTVDQVRSIRDPGPHSIYITMVANHPDLGASCNIVMLHLLNSFFQTLSKLRAEGVEIERIYATGINPEVRSLCDAFGLEAGVASIQGGPVYSGEPEACLAAVRLHLDEMAEA